MIVKQLKINVLEENETKQEVYTDVDIILPTETPVNKDTEIDLIELKKVITKAKTLGWL